MLSDVVLLERVVNQMVNIALHHSMDGWLINIENRIEVLLLTAPYHCHLDQLVCLFNVCFCFQYSQIPNLLRFVSRLTQAMHTAIPHSQVIWYDSVTVSGDLEWQNELNDLNRCVCLVSIYPLPAYRMIDTPSLSPF